MTGVFTCPVCGLPKAGDPNSPPWCNTGHSAIKMELVS